MLIIPLNLDSVLLLLHNSKLAYWLRLSYDCYATSDSNDYSLIAYDCLTTTFRLRYDSFMTTERGAAEDRLWYDYSTTLLRLSYDYSATVLPLK